MRLYELTGELQRLQHAAETSDDQAEMVSALENLGELIEAKCAGIAKVLAMLETDEDACAKEAARLTEKKKRIAANAARLREYVRMSMESRGILKLKAETFSFSIVNCPESVVITDESLVPDEYIRTTVTKSVNKSECLAVYKKFGECVPGTTVERNTRLSIK